ncbi:hypothetical protein BCR33DRAFT_848072 [Rhizoclosmatium globosum]|uniref:TIR domain-containing protein n=1 Tax=Rhizoclosmatium globosum TaxID=329046 RepID=A0A1Y2CNU7_9FUNG|nr:hypothetical protein BCR33DRAFT_848072 [Rhizoclosmatium globosum]|eukprot:ORY48719.1 hypothetical protein BCR33DRAFT_848072 [Rhizoclosmatium globosum]
MVNVVTVRPRKGDADDELSVEISEARVSVLKAAIKETFELQTVSFDLFYAYTGSQSTALHTLKPTPDVKLKTILSKCSNPTTDLIFFFQPHPFRFKVVFEAGGDPLVLEVEDLGVKELRLSAVFRNYQTLCYNMMTMESVLNSDSTLERVYTEATSKKVLPSVFVITAQNPNTSIIPTTVTSKPKIISTTQDISSEKSFDVMLSYSWSTKHLVKSLHTSLLQHTPTLRIWIDDREMDTDIYKGMVEGVLKSSLLLICLSRAYLSSANCNREIKFAADLQKPMVPVRMFDKMAGDDVGALMASRELAVPFLITSGLMYVDFEGLVPGTEGWEGAVRAVVEQVESRLAKVSGSVGGGVLKRAGIEEEDGVGRVLLKNWLQPVDFSVDLENYEAEYVVGTREWVDSVVLQWRESNERVLWVNGGAGTGKSIIAFRLSKFQPDGFKLGSVFFCRHNDEQKNSPEKVVASMAWDLASRFPVVKAHMEAVMDQNILEVAESGKSSLLSRPIEAFQSLIIGGLNILGEHHKQMNTPYNETILLIVDALDECDPKSRHLLLKILSQSCEALPEFVKVFVTARPDLDIFNSLTKTDPFVLKTTSKENWDDIEKFISTRFASIWKLSVDQLQQNQELTECVKELVVKSEGVFIYARNACELLSNEFQFADPKAMLKEIQNLDFGPDSIYSVILNREFLTEQDLDEFRHVFGTILGVKEPVSLPTLMVVGTLTSVETGRVVSKLRSILKIEQGIVSVIHKSLKDFLTDNKRCGQNFFVNLAEVNHEHTLTCLDLMNKQLKYNMANLDASKEYKHTESNFAIDKDLEYACIFWGNM